MILTMRCKELGVSDQSQLVVMILKGFLGASVLQLGLESYIGLTQYFTEVLQGF